MAADSPRHLLSVSEAVRDRLFALNVLAKRAGILPEWIATMRQALERIQAEPEHVGDPLFRMRHLNLTNYRLLANRVCMFYAVHDWEPVIVLKSVAPVHGHPLEGAE